jgi:hypothetical protein
MVARLLTFVSLQGGRDGQRGGEIYRRLSVRIALFALRHFTARFSHMRNRERRRYR